MLDANALILLLAGHERTVARASECEAGDICISAIAFAEVAHGSFSGKPPQAGVLRRVRERIPVLPFDVEAADQYARMPFGRHRLDRLIAAHARALGLVVVTANPRDFNDVLGLVVEDWTQ